MRFLRYIAILLTVALVVPALARPVDEHRFTVVLDAGHGGKDNGCMGKRSKEKDLVLSVIKLLGEKIKDEYEKDVDVVFTRNGDYYVSLQERADIANKAAGDLFISVHIDSAPYKNRKRSTLSGMSVYTCGLHKSDSNLEVAMRENSVLEFDPNFEETYQGFNPQSSESYIIFELSQNKHLERSVEFASMAHDRLRSTAGRESRGVRQAGFWVLWATSMPAVLVELDFMCNPNHEKFLMSKEGQEQCAEALFEAFEEYYSKVSGKDVVPDKNKVPKPKKEKKSEKSTNPELDSAPVISE